MFWVLWSLAVPTERGGETGRRRGEKLSSSWIYADGTCFTFCLAIWSLLKLMTSSSNTGPPANYGTHHTHIHTLTGNNSSHRVSVFWWSAWKVYACVQCVCVCMCVWFSLARTDLQIHTNVFISTRPVKMSSLCLFSPHSEWHNTGLKDAIINLNVPWHFLTPLSTT